MIDYNQLSPDSRVWVYQSNRPFNTEEIDWLNQQLWDFVSQWATHSNKVKGYGSIYKNQFIVLVADESVYDVSGCSTDSLMRFIKEIEKALNVNLFDRMSVACEINGEIVTMSSEDFRAKIEAGQIDDDTIVFNNLVQTKTEFDHQWRVPLRQSWHKKVFAAPSF